jgi:alpha-tubulin suppressor-like RCC1 family protein
LFGVGANAWGCIGYKIYSSLDFFLNQSQEVFSIKQIDYFKDIFIVDYVCGSGDCLSISKKGEIYSWGNYYGQIGNGKSGGNNSN